MAHSPASAPVASLGVNVRIDLGGHRPDHEALMFFPEGQVRVLLYGQPVNMRLSFDDLYALDKHVMHQIRRLETCSRSSTAALPRSVFCTSTAAACACGPSVWSKVGLSATGPTSRAVRWTRRDCEEMPYKNIALFSSGFDKM